MRNKRSRKRSSEDASLLRGLTDRLEKMEKRLEAVEEELELLPLPNIPVASWAAPHQSLGRKPGLPTPVLLYRRDNLIIWLERNWPELQLAIRQARKPADLIPAFSKLKPLNVPHMPEFMQEPGRYLPQLWAFLKSGRCHGNPRNIANAMAGVPKQSWKRSFDIGCSNPSKLPLDVRAYRDYLRRKFPERLRELLRVKTPEKVAEVLSRSRTEDVHYLVLCDHPDKVREWLEEGKPFQY